MTKKLKIRKKLTLVIILVYILLISGIVLSISPRDKIQGHKAEEINNFVNFYQNQTGAFLKNSFICPQSTISYTYDYANVGPAPWCFSIGGAGSYCFIDIIANSSYDNNGKIILNVKYNDLAFSKSAEAKSTGPYNLTLKGKVSPLNYDLNIDFFAYSQGTVLIANICYSTNNCAILAYVKKLWGECI